VKNRNNTKPTEEERKKWRLTSVRMHESSSRDGEIKPHRGEYYRI